MSSDKIRKTDQQWRVELGADVFAICRNKGTERAFSGKYRDTKTDGTYQCVCCGAPLFSSAAKYDSGSGWPSFYEPVAPELIEQYVDHGHGMIRIEVICRRCDSHLGHIFDDGPAPTGLRYCINSASLKLIPD